MNGFIQLPFGRVLISLCLPGCLQNAKKSEWRAESRVVVASKKFRGTNSWDRICILGLLDLLGTGDLCPLLAFWLILKILVAASRSPAANWAFSETCVLLGRPHELRRAATKLRARQRAISIRSASQRRAASSPSSQSG